MGSLSLGATVSALVALSLSGCIGDDRGTYLDGPFSVAAPSWQAGYSWEWETSSQHITDLQRGDGTRLNENAPGDTVRNSLSIFNTSRPIRGEDVYYGVEKWQDLGDEADEALDADVLEGQLVVFRQSDLRTIGRGWIDLARGPSSAASINLDDSRQEPPDLRFPLESGASWSVTSQDGDPISYDVRVVGRQQLEVLGQPETAVHVRVVGKLEPGHEREFMEEFEDDSDAQWESISMQLSFTGDYYWGEYSLNLVRSSIKGELRFSATGYDGDGQPTTDTGRLQVREDKRLASFSLVSGPETPVPPAEVRVPDDLDLESIRTLTARNDLEGRPVDVGEAPATVRFYIGDNVHGYYGPSATFNESRFEARWTVQRVNDGQEIAAGTGNELPVTLELPGTYAGRLAIVDRESGEEALQSWSYVEAGWSQRRSLKQEPGFSQRAPILTFPVVGDYAYGQFTFQVQRAQPAALRDQGSFVLVYPSGEERALYLVGAEDQAQGYVMEGFGEPGEYQIHWEPDQALTYGDDLTIDVTMQYPADPYRYAYEMG